jgi:hypothetical protein
VNTGLLFEGLTAFAAILAALVSLRNSLHVKSLRVEINHRLTELLEERGKAEHAAGRREGVESK